MNYNYKNNRFKTNTNHKLKNAIRLASQCLAAGTLIFTGANVIAAEATEATKEKIEAEVSKEIEELMVTGSRLARNPSELASQVLSYDEAYIKASGETTIERFLRRLPQSIVP